MSTTGHGFEAANINEQTGGANLKPRIMIFTANKR
jgi:hypothetical protein